MLHLNDDSPIQKCMYCNRIFTKDPLDSYKLIDDSDAIYAVTQNLHAAEKIRESQLKQEKIDEIMNRVEIALEHSNIRFEDNAIKKETFFSIEKEKSKQDERQTLSEIFGFLENSRLSRNVIINDLQNWFATFQEEVNLLSESTFDEEEIAEESFEKLNKAFRNSISKMNRLSKLIQNGIFMKDNRNAENELLTETTIEISKSSNSLEHGTIDTIKVPKRIYNEKELAFSKNLEVAIKTINAVLDNAISTSSTKHAKNNFTYCSKQFNYVSSHLEQKKKHNEELIEKLKLATVEESIINSLHEQSKKDLLLINDLQNEINDHKDRIDSLENQIRLSDRKNVLSEYRLRSPPNVVLNQIVGEETALKTKPSNKQLFGQTTTNNMVENRISVIENRVTEELPSASYQKLLIPSSTPSKSLQNIKILSEDIANRSTSNLLKKEIETPKEIYNEEKKTESVSKIKSEHETELSNSKTNIVLNSSSKPNITLLSNTSRQRIEKINSKHQNTVKDGSEKKQKDLKNKIRKRKKKIFGQANVTYIYSNSNEHIDLIKEKHDQTLAAEQFDRNIIQTKLKYEKKLQTLRNFIVNEQYRFEALLRKTNLEHNVKIDQLKNVNSRIIQALVHFQHIINRLTDSSDEDYKILYDDTSDIFQYDQSIECETKYGHESKTAVEILVDLERKICNLILKKNQSVQNANSDKLQFSKDLQHHRSYLKQIIEAFSVQQEFAKDVEIKNTMLSEEYKKVLKELLYLENPSHVSESLQHISNTSFYKITNDLINHKDAKPIFAQEIPSQSSQELKYKMLDFFENHQIANSEASIANDIIDYIQDITNEQFIELVTQYVSFTKIQQMKRDMKDIEKSLLSNFNNHIETLIKKHSEKCAEWKIKHRKLQTRKKTALLLLTEWFQQLNNTKIAVQSFPVIHVKSIIADNRQTDANRCATKSHREGFKNAIVRLNCHKKSMPEELGEIIGTSLNNNKEPDTLWKIPDKSLDHLVHVYTPKILELDCNKKLLTYKEPKCSFPAIATLYP